MEMSINNMQSFGFYELNSNDLYLVNGGTDWKILL